MRLKIVVFIPEFWTECDLIVLILASASPRRSELLCQWGYAFRQIEAPVDEQLPAGIRPETGVQELARRKALAGYCAWQKQNAANGDLILGADTIVVLQNRILGKPRDAAQAEEMLQALSGNTHQVMTAVALAYAGPSRDIMVETAIETTTVSFRPLSRTEIRAYIATGEPMDKAAAYGIQGGARSFVREVRGSLTNVIGLPMERLAVMLKKWGITPKT